MITIKYVYMIKYIDWKNKTLKNLFMFYRTHYVDFSVIMAGIAIYPSATEETRLSNVRHWYKYNGYALVTEWID